MRHSWTRRNLLYAIAMGRAAHRTAECKDSRADLTRRAVGDDKGGNAYYVGSVLRLPNAMQRPTPPVWAYAEMRRSATLDPYPQCGNRG